MGVHPLSFLWYFCHVCILPTNVLFWRWGKTAGSSHLRIMHIYFLNLHVEEDYGNLLERRVWVLGRFAHSWWWMWGTKNLSFFRLQRNCLQLNYCGLQNNISFFAIVFKLFFKTIESHPVKFLANLTISDNL